MGRIYKEKAEIFTATWEGRSGPGYSSNSDFSSHDNQSSSLWLSLRGVVPDDSYSYMSSDCRAIGDKGLYVSFGELTALIG